MQINEDTEKKIQPDFFTTVLFDTFECKPTFDTTKIAVCKD